MSLFGLLRPCIRFASTMTTIVAELQDLRSRSVSGIGLTRCVSCAVIPRDFEDEGCPPGRFAAIAGRPSPIRTTASLTNSPCRLDLWAPLMLLRGPRPTGNAAAFRGRSVTPHHGLPSENRAARQSEGSVKPLDMSEFRMSFASRSSMSTQLYLGKSIPRGRLAEQRVERYVCNL